MKPILVLINSGGLLRTCLQIVDKKTTTVLMSVRVRSGAVIAAFSITCPSVSIPRALSL